MIISFSNKKRFNVHKSEKFYCSQNSHIYWVSLKKILKSDNSRIFENIQNDNFKIVN